LNPSNPKTSPKLTGDDDPSNYLTKDEELIAHVPVIKEEYRGQDEKMLEVTHARWTDVFIEGNQVLFAELHQTLGTPMVWKNAKSVQKAEIGCKAYRSLYNTLFWDNIVFFRSEANHKQITQLSYDGKQQNFDIDDYVIAT
jgi:hypothetical protein